MSLGIIKPGSRITRVYYSVPEHHGYGPEFDTWDDAVRHAQARRAELVARLTESLAGFSTPDEIARTADVQVRIDLCWSIEFPDGGGSNVYVESYTDVARLRPYRDNTENARA